MNSILPCLLLLSIILLSAHGETVTANFTSAATVPVTAADYNAAGNEVKITLSFAPLTGTQLTIVKNTGLSLILGQFTNLAHGQRIGLAHGGITHPFVANYYGGSGNDLVLQWAYQDNVTWGRGESGQLGNNNTTNSSVPVAVTSSGELSGRTVIATAAGNFHSLALCSDGKVAAWGYNNLGQLGNNNTTNSSEPVAVTSSGELSGRTVIAVAAGNFHSLALCSDGKVAAWGYNILGQLGNNNTTNSSVPVAVTSTGALSGRTVVAVSGGENHSLALCSDGNVAAWGGGSSGQLGNNGTASSSVPVAVTSTGALAGKTVVAIAGGKAHSLALCSDGKTVAWGNNYYGQLGNNSNTNSSVPVATTVTGVLSGKTVVAVAAGIFHSLALCSDGKVVAWGYNSYGQLGNNSTVDSSVPVVVTSTGALAGKTVVAIAAGGNHSLALCSDGKVVGWGFNNYGELGNNSTADRSVPVAVTSTGTLSGKAVVAAAAGGNHSLALASTPFANLATLSSLSVNAGTLNPFFSSNTTSYSVDVPDATSTISLTPTSADPNATVTVNGFLVASGISSQNIPLETGTNVISTVVTAQYGGATYAYTVSVNRRSSDSALSSLTLGSGSLSPEFSSGVLSYAATVAAATASVTISPTAAHAAAAIEVNGAAVASGTGKAVNLAVGSNTITIVVTAEDTSYATTYNLTILRPSNLCTLSALSLSTGTLSPSFSPNSIAYSASVPNVVGSVSIRPTVTQADATVKVNGAAVVSGAYSQSIPLVEGGNAISVVVTAQDGVAMKTYTVTVIRQVDLAANFSSLSSIPVTTGGYSATDKRVNFSLDFAPPTGTNLTVVKNTELGFISGHFLNLAQGQVVTMAFNQTAYCFVANYYGGTGNDLVLQWVDTKAYAWGSNSLGQLGDGSGSNSNLPVAVTNTGILIGRTIVAAAVGSSHSVALCGDGSLAAWGNNTYGQLGDGSNENRAAPVAVTAATGALNGKTVVGVAAGFNHSLALCSDGTVAAWGMNSVGQLGNGGTVGSSVPVAVKTSGTVLGGKVVVAVFAGYNHSLARCADGTVVAWGSNAFGQLGNNSTSNSNVAINITNSGELLGRTVISLVGGSDHCVALCSDGTLLAWGSNNYGQLGNDSATNSGIPVVVDASDVLAGKAVVSIAAGGWHSVATCSDGTMAAFGRNANGQLGNGLDIDSAVPVAVDATGVLVGRDPLSVGGSNAHSLMLCADGTLAAWGSNNNGQLGNGTTVASGTPVAVSTNTLAVGERFCGLATGSSASHVLAIVAQPPPQNQPFSVWQATHFPDPADQANQAISGETATPAGDGITNLMKYALGLNPWVCGSSDLPVAGQHEGYLTLTYRKNKQATDVVYTVQAGDSVAVGSWSAAETVVSQADVGDHRLVTVRDNVLMAGNPKRFMRLKVAR